MTDPISSSFRGVDLLCSKGITAIIDESLKIIECNKAFEDFTGYLRQEIINASPEIFIAAIEHEKANELLTNALSGRPENEYLSFITPKKEKRVGNVSLVPFFEDGVAVGVYCFIKDVSVKIKNNKKTFDSEQRLKAIFDSEPECVKIVSIDGLVLDINPAGLRMLEAVEKEEVIGANVYALVHEEDRDAFKQLHQKVCKGEIGSLQFRLQGLKGCKRWMETSSVPLKNRRGQVTAALSVTRDITEKKEAEQQIKQSEERFKKLVSNGSDIIVIVDESANFRYISDNIVNFLGYTPGFLLNKNAFDFIHPDDKHKVFEELQKVIMKDDSALGVSHRFLNDKGEWVWLESKGINHLADPYIEGVIINAREITDRIRLQNKLDEELANRQKQITAAVIETQEKERSQLGLELHDNVNQVLTTIKLYNEMLLEGIGDQKDILNRSVRHLQSCINEIRSISKRLSAPTLGKISLDESIKELISSINLTNRVQIAYSIVGLEKCTVSQDLHLAVYRIIQEHLNNILKYANASIVSIELLQGNNNLLLSVVDDGVGFDINKKSSGIGITNMRSRAEHMGGAFTLQSIPGKGTTLTVKFPLERTVKVHPQ